MRNPLLGSFLSCVIGCSLLVAPSAFAAPDNPTGAPPPDAPAAATPAPPAIVERVFQRQLEGKSFTITVRATGRVPAEMVDLLEKQLRVVRIEAGRAAAELAFWRMRPMVLDPERKELQVELRPASSGVDPADFIWTWPEVFRISRPGVLEVRPQYENLRPQPGAISAPRAPLDVDPDSVSGRLLCRGQPLPFVQVVVAGHAGRTSADGRFAITGPFPSTPTTVFVAYEANIRLSASVAPRLQIMDDFHVTRNESVNGTPTVSGGIANFGNLTAGGPDCVLWQWGRASLSHYFGLLGTAPPAGELRVKRWSAVFESAGAGAHTFYDYLVIPTDFVDRRGSRDFFHEFGHSIRHVADGDETHWHWDDTRFIYARMHTGTEVTNKGYAFNEGWAGYWGSAVSGSSFPLSAGAPAASFMDWNEDRIALRLWALANASGAGHARMVRVLLANRGAIHTIYQFEQKYCAAIPGGTNAFCSHGVPLRAPPSSCPPGYNDDGATCRLINIVGKPSAGRGAGIVPSQCPAGKEYDAGLCYPLCPSGFDGVGPVCWQVCPAGYHDDGATCRRDAKIIGANNSSCPWYDKCGLTFAKGCSACPGGYHNDGCTCRIDVDIFGKRSQGRGVGTVPDGCRPGQQLDAGLCYQPCPAGYNGVGPVCWGTCPAGFDDHGATCYRPPNIFSDD